MIRSANEAFAVINLVLLGFIAIIPSPTSLLGEHGDQPTVVILYALIMSGAGILGPVSWLYAARNGLAVEGLSERWIRLAAMRGLTGPLVFLGSLPLILISTTAAEYAWLLVFPLQTLVARAQRREAAG